MPAGDQHPFDYPVKSHKRRHNPSAYRDYHSFKSFLRDEFIFRCVYCLSRETWNLNDDFFGVEHFQPKRDNWRETGGYFNLLYACNHCNSAKGTAPLSIELHRSEEHTSEL